MESLEVLIHLFVQNLNMKRNYWLHFHYHNMPYIRQKWNTMENLDIHLKGYNTLLLWLELTFAMQPIVWQPKIWHLPYLVSKVSNDVFNIWLVTHINLYFILLILMIDQISSGLHGVEIKLTTTQPKIAYNVTKMQTMPEFSRKDGQFR